MCIPKPPPAPQPPPTPAPPTPAPPLAAASTAPLATMAPAEGSSRKDAGLLAANRRRSSLRIDRSMPETGSSGTGLNIPV